MTDPILSHQAACAALVRRHDRERYLVSLFAGAGKRDGLLAILAANHEIAKTAEVVSDPTIGLIRLQWWREAFDGIEAGSPREHEVILPLARVADTHPEVLDHLRRVVDAREADLADDPPADLEALEGYAGETGGEVVAAMARVLGADIDMARDLGTAWALIGLVRALPVLIAASRAPLPESLLKENNITLSRIKDMPASIDLSGLCLPIIDLGMRRLEAAQKAVALARPEARPLRLLAARTADLGAELLRHGGDPRAVALPPAPPGLIWRHGLRAAVWGLGF